MCNNFGGNCMNINSEKILIKEFDEKDNFSEVFELSKDFFYEYAKNNEDFFGIDCLTEVDIKKYFDQFIGKENNKAYIAKYENAIIGHITLKINNQQNYWKVKKVGVISGLMVSKKYRKNGIGTKLVMKGIEYFRQNGVKYYTVFTSVNNLNGISLYKKCGFEELHINMLGRI